MSWLQIVESITVVGAVAVGVLIWLFVRQRKLDQVQELLDKRKASSKTVSRAHLVEGNERIPVALALTDSIIHYENHDLQAFLELNRIEEVEYDNELSIGTEVEHGRVLRLRSHGQTFEFILEKPAADQWLALLPPHRMDEPGNVHAV
ncbi:MAG TPA: hypothetical protein VIL97_06640 [Thermoanaerobaculia bacterium]|nr:hypothetical protein [Rhodothermia bacterium]